MKKLSAVSDGTPLKNQSSLPIPLIIEKQLLTQRKYHDFVLLEVMDLNVTAVLPVTHILQHIHIIHTVNRSTHPHNDVFSSKNVGGSHIEQFIFFLMFSRDSLIKVIIKKINGKNFVTPTLFRS